MAMKSLVGVVLAAIFCGFVRIVFVAPPLAPITFAEAAALAQAGCLPGSEVPAGQPVSLTRLPPAASIIPPAATGLAVTPAAETTIDALEPALRDRLEGAGEVTLPAGTMLRVGAGEVSLAGGSVLARRAGGRDVLLRVPDAARFRVPDGASVVVRLDRAVTSPAGQPRKLRAGAQLTLLLPGGAEGGPTAERQPVSLVPLQPLAVRPWAAETPATIVPVSAAALRGFGDMAVEARQSGFDFGAQGLRLTACAWSAGEAPRVAGVVEAKPDQPGAATVILSIPSAIVPPFGRFARTVRVLVTSADGQYLGYGGFDAIARAWAGTIATVLIAVLLALILRVRAAPMGDGAAPGAADSTAMAAGLFIGADGAPSLSLFQIFFWTVIAVWGLVFVYIVTGTLLTMTTSMLALLGIAGTGSVLARWIGVGNTPPGAAAGAATRQSPPKVDMGLMLSTNGSFDLLKLQLFVFTLMIGAYVVWRVMDSGAFPDLDTNTLLLLGVSQGVYIGGKVASTTTIAKARTLKLDLDVQTEALSRRRTERDAKDAAKAAAVQALAAETDPAMQQQREATIGGLTGEIAALDRTIGELQATIEARKVELQKLYQELGLVA